MPNPDRAVSRPLVFAAALAVAIVAAYAPSLDGDFLWDDDLHITANPTIVGPLGLKEIWTTARANYFPLVLTNFWVQQALWGVEPGGYRWVTLGFHVAAALLLWRVLLRLRIPGAWLGAALWALHPVQVESVAWICELKNTQSAVFFLAAIWSWIRWLEAGRLSAAPRLSPNSNRDESKKHPAWILRHPGLAYALALLCALLAILSKPSTVMLPVALGLCAWWWRGRPAWSDLVRLAPFFALSALAAGWTIWEQKYHSGAVGPDWSQTLPERIVIAGRVIWFYLGKLLWPDPLTFIYPRWEIDAAQPAAYLATAAALLALGGLAWRARGGHLRPGMLVAAYFVALLFPVLGFFSVYFFRYSFVGDHFQYLAGIGPLALAGAMIMRLGRRVAPWVGVGLLVALGLATARQSRVYRSNEALWRDTVTHNPVAVMAWLNLADTYAQTAHYDEAMATYRRALELKPTDPDGWNDLGNVLTLTGRPGEAVAHFERALALKPDFADAHSNLGNALRSLGRSDEAIAHYRQALALKPNYPGALNNLGAELAERGRPEEALPIFQQALQLRPDDAGTLNNLAGTLRALGRWDEAIERHREVVRLKPNFAEGHANFGCTLVATRRESEALEHLERALALEPSLTSARGQYALALAALGRPAEAMAHLERAVELAPASAEAHQNLGTALAQSGRLDDAIEHFETAVRLEPGLAGARVNLGTARLAQQRWPDAIAQLTVAATLQPESADIRAQLAVAFASDGQLDAAVPHFEAALRLNSARADVHENFGRVLDALGRRREAFEHLEEAARLRRTGFR